MDIELNEMESILLSAIIKHTQKVKGTEMMTPGENQDCIDLAISTAKEIESPGGIGEDPMPEDSNVAAGMEKPWLEALLLEGRNAIAGGCGSSKQALLEELIMKAHPEWFDEHGQVKEYVTIEEKTDV